MAEIKNLKRISPTENILQFWSSQTFLDENYVKFIHGILSIPATQVSVERTFSDLSHIMNNRRNNLSQKNLNNLVFLRNDRKK